MARAQKTIVCREAGVTCDWEVRDSDEDEVLRSARDHARRRHDLEYTVEEMRPALRDVRLGGGGI
jgi:predicted small metal-binding protein